MVAGLGALQVQVAEIDSRDPPDYRLVLPWIALSSGSKILHFLELCSNWSIRLADSPTRSNTDGVS